MKANKTLILAGLIGTMALTGVAFGHGYGRGMMDGTGPRADCPYRQEQLVRGHPHHHHAGGVPVCGDYRGQGLRDGTGPREDCPLKQPQATGQADQS